MYQGDGAPLIEYSLHTPAQVAHDLTSRAKALRLLMG